MITKEQWQQLRIMEEIPLFLWFEYYRENNGIISDMNVFESQFYNIIARQPLIVSRKTGKPVRVGFDTAVNRLYNYYSNKFPE